MKIDFKPIPEDKWIQAGVHSFVAEFIKRRNQRNERLLRMTRQERINALQPSPSAQTGVLGANRHGFRQRRFQSPRRLF